MVGAGRGPSTVALLLYDLGENSNGGLVVVLKNAPIGGIALGQGLVTDAANTQDVGDAPGVVKGLH